MENKKITIESLAADERFQRYCLKPGAAEKKYWKNWLNDNPDAKETFAKAKDLVQSLQEHISEEEIGTEWNKFANTIANPNNKASRPRIYHLFRLRNVAAVLLLIVSVVVIRGYLSPTPTMRVVQTNLGVTDSILLADQTKIVLNANSSIEFSENWENAKEREVWLSGEAWFEVNSNPDKPFIVHTPKGDIRVLGTVFNALQRADYFDVVLAEGSIQLELENNQTIAVQPGEQVLVTGQKVQKQKVNLKPLTAWRHGKLVFKNSSVQEIINRLQEEYGWTISVEDDGLLERKVNASVPSNKPELLLKALKEIYEFDIQEIQEGTYLIR